jgi:dipeptidyl-peptidase-3
MYQPETRKWLQAHSQARYAIARVLINDAPGLVKIEQLKNEEDGKDDLLFHFDAEKIETVGKKAICDFLLKLQVLKSTANSKKAVDLFDALTRVDNNLEYPYLKIRSIAVDRRKPRKIFVQSTILKGKDDEVSIKSYPASLEGMIESFVTNFPEDKVTSLFRKMQQFS